METPAVETGVVVKLDRGFPLVRLAMAVSFVASMPLPW